MTHLSESEFVDLAENEAADVSDIRAAHVGTCASCRAQLDALRSMLRETKAVDVPEPSPLLWEHMANRVRAGVAAEPAPQPGWNGFGIRGLLPLAAAVALCFALFYAMRWIPIGLHEGAGPVVADRTPTATPGPARRESAPDAENAEVWAVLTAAASDVAFEDAHAAGMRVLPAAIDHAVQDLTEAELTELGRLLQSELKRSSN